MQPYVLITPARDEEAYIEKTIHSVVSQTVLPERWVIVSDGSVDRTDEIINRYSNKHDFILLLRRAAEQERNYGSKALAFQIGYKHLEDLEFDFIGNLDADVSFDSRYYESILSEFQGNKRLGLAGGIRFDFCGGRFRKVRCARNSVGGPFQLFRRQCYEEIGGYQPLRFGGIDSLAETMARRHGWEVESFPKLKVYHYRCTGTSGGNILRAKFKAGMIEYSLGYHPLFHIARCAFRVADYPPVVGSFSKLAGYCWATLRYDKEVPQDFIQYLRSEQLARLRSVLLRYP